MAERDMLAEIANTTLMPAKEQEEVDNAKETELARYCKER